MRRLPKSSAAWRIWTPLFKRAKISEFLLSHTNQGEFRGLVRQRIATDRILTTSCLFWDRERQRRSAVPL